MVSLQQSILSLQVQFNSVCSQVETKKRSQDSKIFFSHENLVTLERIVKKADEAYAAAQKEKNAKVQEIGGMQRAIQGFSNRLKSVKHPEEIGQLSDCGNEIKKAIHDIYLALFTPNPEGPQRAEINAENDADMAAGDWIVERASKEVKAKYPKTFIFLSLSVKEIKKGQAGCELQEALEMFLPTLWSLETLLKLAILALGIKKQPLSEIDCFPLTEENLGNFAKLSEDLQSVELSMMHHLLLHADEIDVTWTPYITQLNRFVEQATITRQEALGLMNLLQRKLSESDFLDPIEALVTQGKIQEALTQIKAFKQQAQHASALCYMAYNVPSLEALRTLLPCIRSLEYDEMRDDTLQQYVTVIFDKFSDHYLDAYEVIKDIDYWAQRNPLYARLVHITFDRDPEFCLTVLLHHWRDQTRLVQFVEKHGAKHFLLCHKAISAITDQKKRQAVLLGLKDSFAWVSEDKVDDIAGKITGLCTSFRNNVQIQANLVKAIIATNFSLGLQLALNMAESATRQIKLRAFAAGKFGNVADPAFAMRLIHLAQALGPTSSRDDLLKRLMGDFFTTTPLHCVTLFCTVDAEARLQERLQQAKEAMKGANVYEVYKLIDSMTFKPHCRDELLGDLFALTLSFLPSISFDCVWSVKDPAMQKDLFRTFYTAVHWTDFNQIIAFSKMILLKGRRDEFLTGVIRQVWKQDPAMAIDLSFLLSDSVQREALFEQLQQSAEGDGERVHDAIIRMTDPNMSKQFWVERIFSLYQKDTVVAKNMLSVLEPISLRDSVTSALVQKIALREKTEALEFVLFISEEKVKEQAIMAMATQMAEVNWQEAVAFAHSIKDSMLSFQFILSLEASSTAREKGYKVNYVDMIETI